MHLLLQHALRELGDVAVLCKIFCNSHSMVLYLLLSGVDRLHTGVLEGRHPLAFYTQHLEEIALLIDILLPVEVVVDLEEGEMGMPVFFLLMTP